MANGRLAPAVVLDRYEAHRVMERLRKYEGPLLRGLHDKIFRTWQLKGAQPNITVPLTQRELEVLRRLGATSHPQVIRYRWFAIYVRDRGEVFTQTTDKPPKHKTLRVPGQGRKKFALQQLYQLPNGYKESSEFMARKKAAAKKVTEDEDIDELEGLEELEDEDEVEAEEPDVEDDDDDEEEAKPKKRTRKKAAEKPARKKRTRKAAVVEEDEDEDEDDDEEDEPAPKKRKKAATSKKSSKKGKGGPAAGKTTKEATGGVGTAELAEAASEIADVEITGRDVRVYLRKNEVEKDAEHGRYVWASEKNKTFLGLAKKIAKEYAE